MTITKGMTADVAVPLAIIGDQDAIRVALKAALARLAKGDPPPLRVLRKESPAGNAGSRTVEVR